MTGDSRPVLFVTNYAPPARVGAFALLAEREQVEFALFGGRLRHGAREPRELPFPHRRVGQREAGALAGGGAYRAVVCGTVGRMALPAAYLGARRAGVPFVLWATLWAQPMGPAGVVGYPFLRWIYSHAHAVATYGPHVSAYVRARGARRVHEAPQAVDNEFWRAGAAPPPGARRAPFQVLFAGRLAREKGVRVLLDAWRMTGLGPPDAALILVGGGPERARAATTRGIVSPGEADPVRLRNFYAASDVVVMPSIPTLTFREPWGLVANEAMNRGLPVIATDAVGAAAGGLVRHERNGLVVPAGDPARLASAIIRLRDPALRAQLGSAARADIAAYDHAAWADGMTRALADVGASQSRAGRGLAGWTGRD
ncbi:MAG: glycosyltransferase family 4 protein [Solirubrobacteraceae bacterium]